MGRAARSRRSEVPKHGPSRIHSGTVRAGVLRQRARAARAADPMRDLIRRLSQGEIRLEEYRSIQALIENYPGHVPVHPRPVDRSAL